ncbi:acyl-CoA thioesterase [Aminobacterium mobile]|uniref:acyl-CoA thioesterase n=1 Tax=Aminobacterium mobile TaxID=81467 RepID=UPI00046458A4|nr:thioesterase family protein [Aminobacterium mobile]
MREVTISLRVRYGETDQMGVVYYANYLTWFEIGRTEYCRALSTPYVLWEERGVFLPVVEVHCRYKASAYYDDVICVSTWVQELKQSSINFCYRVFRKEDSKLLVEGWTRHAFVDKAGRLLRGAHPFYQWIQKYVEGEVHGA